MSWSSEELRHVVCILLRSGRRRLSVCLLLPVLVHAPAELSRRPREQKLRVPSARTTLPYGGKLATWCKNCALDYRITVISGTGIVANRTPWYEYCVQQQRRLDLLTITHPKNLEAGKKVKVVFITARIHPGETPSSVICQGQIRQKNSKISSVTIFTYFLLLVWGFEIARAVAYK